MSFRPALAAALVALASATASLPAPAQNTPTASASDPEAARQLQAFFERAWDEGARLMPEWATFRGDHRYGNRFTDMSPAGRAQLDARSRELLAEARKFPLDKLSTTDRISVEMFIEQRQREVEAQAFEGFRTMSLRSLWGTQSALAGLMQMQPVNSRERVEQLFERLAAYPQRMDQELVILRRGVALGWIPSRDVLQRVLSQIDGQLATAATDKSPWFVPFTRLPASMPEPEREQLRTRGREAIAQRVVPPMQKLRAFVVDEALPKAPASGAMRGYPGGEQVYAFLVRQSTTTNLTPREIHDIGQRELTRLRNEMEGVMRETKFSGNFAQFIQYLNSDPKFFHTSPEALLAGYRDIAKRVDAELPKLFAELPRAPYGVVAMPAHLGNSAEYYNSPPLDGSRAGYFFANTVAYKTRPIWAMETLVAHEAVPGHHLQNARAIELRGLPAFRRGGGGYTAYGEGWGLYAETLGFDVGLYTDPYSRFGHLQWQAFRAARLVVDTGLHALGWSRTQAIDFMIERTGVDREFVESEVDRYTSQPGQALAYMIGQLKITELREKAKTKLGARFDIRKFHNAVLDQGPMPLTTLERVIDDWIAEQAKA